MKAINLINDMVPFLDGCGICISNLFETQAEFVDRWFGSDTTSAIVVSGLFKNNARYVYIYENNANSISISDISDLPDIIVIDACGQRVFLYIIE
jgi:hypothetical protein